MSRFLITGGAGFIGSHLARALAADGARVRVLDDFSTGRRENLHGAGKNIEIVEGDVRERAAVREAMKGVECVLHEAAIASVPASIEDPVTTNDVNVTGTLHLLEAATEAGVRRFVFASSTAVYGDGPTLPVTEDAPPAPCSPYAASKLIGETYGFTFHRLHGLPFTALRYFNVYGPGQDEHSPYAAVIPLFIEKILGGERPVIFGDGRQSRDFIHVSDVVLANRLALEREEAVGRVFNVGRGDETDLNRLAASIAALVGSRIEPLYEAPRPGDIVHSRADIDRARKLLGFEPRTELIEGLRNTVEWYRETTRAGGEKALRDPSR